MVLLTTKVHLVLMQRPKLSLKQTQNHYLKLRESLLPEAAAVAVDGVGDALSQSHLHRSTRGPAAFKADEHLLQVDRQALSHPVTPLSRAPGLHADFGDGIA